MSKLFDDTMQGLLEVVTIKNSGIALTEKENMPARTMTASEKECELIEKIIEIRKKANMSQNELAKITGNKQQAISRIEKREHSPSLKSFCNMVSALGHDIEIVKRK